MLQCFLEIIIIQEDQQKDSMAQWIRRWSTEPEILGSIPSGVALFFILFFVPLLVYPFLLGHSRCWSIKVFESWPALFGFPSLLQTLLIFAYHIILSIGYKKSQIKLKST